jgi:EmrB/QacA subfamily drug resistance transporter
MDPVTPTAAPAAIPPKTRALIIASSLLALFLGALDSLVMSAAMPTVVADLGGLDLYSWVYSAYLLARTIALPIFGKLADIYRAKTLYAVSILMFIAASLAAGFAQSMGSLILCRVVQGIGAGGNFALVYIVLAEISPPEERGKTLSLGSFVWGLASVLGPTLGGFIVAYWSWPWIFFINVPLGILSLGGVMRFLVETREKKRRAAIDYTGALTLSATILSILFIFLLAGQTYAWSAPQILALWVLSAASGSAFFWVERRARDPILCLSFFKRRGFSVGNGAVFLSSFAIFAFFGFAPLFIQGALGKSPLEVGTTVLSLSLGWSLGSLVLGRLITLWGSRSAAGGGAVLLAAGSAVTVTFSTATTTATCFWVFALVGVGMGFVALATILVVQNSVPASDLGVATATHQFSRNLGGTVGVGVCGGIFTAGFGSAVESALAGGRLQSLPPALAEEIRRNADVLFRPEIQATLAPEVLHELHLAVAHGATLVFWATAAAAVACLVGCMLLPREPGAAAAGDPRSGRHR